MKARQSEARLLFHRTACANNGVIPDLHPWQHGGISSDQRAVANRASTTDHRARCYMCAHADHAVMVDRGPGVDDRSIPNYRAGLHDGAGHDLNAVAKPLVANDRLLVHETREAEAPRRVLGGYTVAVHQARADIGPVFLHSNPDGDGLAIGISGKPFLLLLA